MKSPAVYILASHKKGTLYIGVTSNLVQRIWQHREDIAEGFTHKYQVKTLVWYEQLATMESAITREKALKKWNRAWKIRLIEEHNPQWQDLWFEITGQQTSYLSSRYSHDSPRHSREGGNPPLSLPETILDSRLRGNDEGRDRNDGLNTREGEEE